MGLISALEMIKKEPLRFLPDTTIQDLWNFIYGYSYYQKASVELNGSYEIMESFNDFLSKETGLSKSFSGRLILSFLSYNNYAAFNLFFEYFTAFLENYRIRKCDMQSRPKNHSFKMIICSLRSESEHRFFSFEDLIPFLHGCKFYSEEELGISFFNSDSNHFKSWLKSKYGIRQKVNWWNIIRLFISGQGDTLGAFFEIWDEYIEFLSIINNASSSHHDLKKAALISYECGNEAGIDLLNRVVKEISVTAIEKRDILFKLGKLEVQHEKCLDAKVSFQKALDIHDKLEKSDTWGIWAGIIQSELDDLH